MAGKQYGVSVEDQRLFAEKQKQRLSLREYFIKQISNPHRHATGEGGSLFDPGMFRFQAMRAKEYDHFRPTPTNGFYAFCIVGAPLLLFGWLVMRDRRNKEHAFRNGEVSYRDRQFKLL